MLNLWGSSQTRFCDGISRRNFLQIGGLALGGMSLPQLLQAEAASRAALGQPAPSSMSHKGVIMIFLAGGPPHQDMFDMTISHKPAFKMLEVLFASRSQDSVRVHTVDRFRCHAMTLVWT